MMLLSLSKAVSLQDSFWIMAKVVPKVEWMSTSSVLCHC